MDRLPMDVLFIGEIFLYWKVICLAKTKILLRQTEDTKIDWIFNGKQNTVPLFLGQMFLVESLLDSISF